MPSSLSDIVRFLDSYLRIGEVPDDPNAVNGLQVEASTEVRTLAYAVDASEAAIEEACAGRAELLLVHHGLFWSGLKPLTGPQGRKLKRLYQSGTSVYSAHLPLDIHPEVGNNACLLRALGLELEGPFGRYQGIEVGLTARCDLSIGELEERMKAAVGTVRRHGGGPEVVRRVGVVSGGGGSLVTAAAKAGLDALVTGEAPHYTAIDAEERSLHLLLGGHWKTETFGVKALAPVLEQKFGLKSFFVGRDTGL